jgi:hypothetical protein
MKNFIIYCLASFLLISVNQEAKATCTPATSAPIDGGFFPADSTQACAEKNQPYSMVIQLKNFGEVATGTMVEWTRIDTVYNLPAGLSWTMNHTGGSPANTLLTDSIGCLNISGTPTANSGVYVLDLWVTVKINSQTNPVTGKASVLVNVLNSNYGTDYDLSYRIFVVNNQSECTNVSGINNLKSVNNLSIYPNPFNEKTLVNFNSTETGKYTARMIDVMGKEVYNETLNVATGSNNVEIKNNGFAKGLYFFIISNGVKAVTRRIVIE